MSSGAGAATVTAFLTVGFSAGPQQKPTVNQMGVDRGYQSPKRQGAAVRTQDPFRHI
jgi:hypothetical protein